MDLLGLARGRRSVRSFRADPVPEEDIRYVIDVARHAPSGANRQPWRFIIVRDRGLKHRIRMYCEEVEKKFYSRAPEWFLRFARDRGLSWRKPHLTDAPVLILVFGYRRAPQWIQSVWLMVGYLILAAAERGYATLTYTPSEVGWANSLLKMPRDYILQVIIPMGKPREKPSFPGRYSIDEVATWI